MRLEMYRDEDSKAAFYPFQMNVEGFALDFKRTIPPVCFLTTHPIQLYSVRKVYWKIHIAAPALKRGTVGDYKAEIGSDVTQTGL